jgi:hypothetical protein
MSIIKNEDGTYNVDLGIAAGIRWDNVVIPFDTMQSEIARINSRGGVLSEFGRPTTHPQWPMASHARLLDLHPERMCGELKDLRIVSGELYTVQGTFVPSGPYGKTAIDLLDAMDPNQPTAKFAMRHLNWPSRKEQSLNTLYKIITWDLIEKVDH